MQKNDFKNRSSLKEARRILRETGLFLLDILYNAIIIIVLVVLIRSFLISPFRVIGSSMADTLASNEFILIDKLSYRLGEPNRGDPIVFRPPITNKYSAKFEEEIITDEAGEGVLDLKPLRTAKPVIYCQNDWVAQFWFCKEPVRSGDWVFFLPASKEGDDRAWKGAGHRAVTDDEAKTGELKIKGDPRVFYSVRFYDSGGPEYFVKRIIGIPGDMIKIDNGRVYLKAAGDGSFQEIEEPYLNLENQNHTYFNQTVGDNEFEVPDGYYFVLGDNRNHSNDSRSWFSPILEEHTPYVPSGNINGKVLVVLWPLSALRIITGADLP